MQKLQIVSELESLMVQFGAVHERGHIDPSQSWLQIGAGFSSLEAMEFVLEAEKRFEVRFRNIEWFVDEQPSLEEIADLILSLQHGKIAAPA